MFIQRLILQVFGTFAIYSTCSLKLDQHWISCGIGAASEGNFIHRGMKSRAPTIRSKLHITQTQLCCAHEMRVTARRLCLQPEERLFVTHGAALRSTSFSLLKRTWPQINKFPSAAARAAPSPRSARAAPSPAPPAPLWLHWNSRPSGASPLILRITSSASSSTVTRLRCRAEVHDVYAS